MAITAEFIDGPARHRAELPGLELGTAELVVVQ
jgi:hypothetical protein